MKFHFILFIDVFYNKNPAAAKQEILFHSDEKGNDEMHKIGKGNINGHRRVKREDKTSGKPKATEKPNGATKMNGESTKGKSSASELIVYVPIYIVSLIVLFQE